MPHRRAREVAFQIQKGSMALTRKVSAYVCQAADIRHTSAPILRLFANDFPYALGAARTVLYNGGMEGGFYL